MGKSFAILTAAVLALAAGGCASNPAVSIGAQTAPNVDLTRYTTYAWLPVANEQGKPESAIDREVRGSLEKNLAAKGYTLDNSGRPSFYVAYQTQTQSSRDVYGTSYWKGAEQGTTQAQGSLVVDFLDPETKQVIWHGTASGVAEHPENPDPKKIDDAVSKLIDRVPHATGSVASASLR